MAGPTRYTPLIFGGLLTPTGNLGVYGSKAASSPAYDSSPQVLQSAQWLQGIFGALAAGDAPYWQDENTVRYVFSTFIQYLMNRGIAEWDYNLVSTGPNVSKTTYNAGDIVRRGPNAGGPHVLLWQVIPTSNGITSDPLQDGTNWIQYIQGTVSPNLHKAWVTFDGTDVTAGNCAVRAGFNVGTVQKIATGYYRVNFTNALPADGSNNGLYGFAGSAGTPNGGGSLNGNNNIINGGGVPGTNVTKTATQCDIFCWEPNLGGSGALEDSNSVSVCFFG